MNLKDILLVYLIVMNIIGWTFVFILLREWGITIKQWRETIDLYDNIVDETRKEIKAISEQIENQKYDD